MEHCKFCDAELEEGSTLCPGCGKDNAPQAQEPEENQVTEAVQTSAEEAAPQEADQKEEPAKQEEKTEEQEEKAEAQEEKKPEKKVSGKKLSTGKLAFAITALVVLVAVLTALVMNGLDKTVVPELAAGQLNDSAVTVPETTAPDGDPSNETCKGNYTASDSQVRRNADVVVATAGDYQLTLGQLQIYYWQEIGGWLSQYGGYAMYFGLDYTQPMEYQMCGIMEGRTWQQYFLASALNSWRTYVALDAAAEVAGYEIDPMYAEYLATLSDRMAAEAANSGFKSAQELMEYNVGVGATFEDYANFMEVYYHGYSYYNHFYTTATASDEEIEEMFALHEAEYAANGLTKETKTVDVRHILILPEGATSESVYTETFDESAWAAAEAIANDLLAQWQAGDMTEESFGALATAHTQDPGSVDTAGLYSDVYQGTMVPAFDEWCFDPARQPGDTGVVRTEYGYHVMYYCSDTLLWKDLVKEDVIGDKTNKMVDEAIANMPLTVDYSKIQLSNAERFYSDSDSLSPVWIFVIAVAAVSAVCVAVVLVFVKKQKKNSTEEN